MPAEPLLPFSRADLLRTFSCALRFTPDGRAHSQARELTAQIAAETLARHLEQAGYVVMRKTAPKPARTP
jgi:hypothetical protein